MDLETLQRMSDLELNELSAVKVMGWENSFVFAGQRYNGIYGESAFEQNWNPVADMNDAMQLQNTVINHHFIGYLSQIVNVTYADDTYDFVTKLMSSTAKQRTIAAILAKEESQ